MDGISTLRETNHKKGDIRTHKKHCMQNIELLHTAGKGGLIQNEPSHLFIPRQSISVQIPSGLRLFTVEAYAINSLHHYHKPRQTSQTRSHSTASEVSLDYTSVEAKELLDITEAIKLKDGEAETYISEIETIGQAYEDMQTQNQHLLQQVAERDDYNTKVFLLLLLLICLALAKQLQQVNTSLGSLRLRIAHNEEQLKVYITEALKSTQEDRRLVVNLETVKWELADAEKELKWLKSAVSSSEKEYEQIQRKMDEIQNELDNERSIAKAWWPNLPNENKRVDLSSLFEENKMGEKEEMRFTTARPASCVISKLDEVAKAVKFGVRLQGLENGGRGNWAD
ncbi:hypothetical protein RJ640_013439 [Escallonia rubra]|uniref:E3 ubiquitin protein ligase n=1 Tax=Escallonia rubra TaxID=112253 RepID=A0AA88UI09_9ASTE|nr:hypothetical protein RJ640_013439 [Escallonia rubra]